MSDIPREFHKCRYCEHVKVWDRGCSGTATCEEAKDAAQIEGYPVNAVYVHMDRENTCPGFELAEWARADMEETQCTLEEVYGVRPGADCPGACNPRPYSTAGR